MTPDKLTESRLYCELYYLVTLLSPPEEYAEEAAHWKSVLKEHLKDGQPILEYGVGGGFNMSHLKKDFDMTAIDISSEMLDVCRLLNPEVGLHLGDMRDFKMDKKFDAVLIHDAVSYLLSEDDIYKTFKNAYHHLNKDGVLIISPDYYKDSFIGPKVSHVTRRKNSIELTYVEYCYDPEPDDSTIETLMTYYIKKDNKLEIEFDKHTTGLFYKSVWLSSMEKCGFRVEEKLFSLGIEKNPYLLIVGKKY